MGCLMDSHHHSLYSAIFCSAMSVMDTFHLNGFLCFLRSGDLLLLSVTVDRAILRNIYILSGNIFISTFIVYFS